MKENILISIISGAIGGMLGFILAAALPPDYAKYDLLESKNPIIRSTTSPLKDVEWPTGFYMTMPDNQMRFYLLCRPAEEE